jgi:hypothetical protein
MQRKQQVGECWVCVIFFARLALVSATLRQGCIGGFEGGHIGGFCRGFRGNPREIFFPREMCHIFASFFVLPRFSCPLLGGFLAHGFFRWFSISG